MVFVSIYTAVFETLSVFIFSHKVHVHLNSLLRHLNDENPLAYI